MYPGIVTVGLDISHPDAADLPGVEGGDLDISDDKAVVSAEIHIDTAGFLAEDASVGGNHSEAGDFIGVEILHRQSG